MASMSSVPTGFPAKLQGPMAWDGASYKTTAADYIYQLSQDDLNDIDKALRYFQGLNLAPGYVTPETFPLSPRLAALLANISEELHEGRGFGVLRGLNPRKYKPAENVIVFAGVASYVGGERATDPAGLTLSHIRNATKDKLPPGFSPEQLRPSKRPEAMAFHSDTAAGDILAMYIKGLQIGSGGAQYLASFWQIYNVLAKEAPHVLQTLANPFPWEEVDPNTKKPHCVLRPIIFYVDNKVQVQFVTVPLRGSLDHPRPKELTPLTAAQEEALDKLQSVAERLSLELDRELGDIQFVNNFSILHGRTAYCEEVGEKAATAAITTTDNATTKTDSTSKVWAQMVTKVEVTTILTETIQTTNEGPATESTVATEPIKSSFTVGSTEISTTTTATTKKSTKEKKITITSTTAEVTTYTTKTMLPGGDTVIVKHNTNSPTTEPAKSENIVTDEKVNGDENKSIKVTTTTTTSYRLLPDEIDSTSTKLDTAKTDTAKSSAIGTGALVCPTLAPRHFLRLFLRDKTRAWRKPEIYDERINNCFATLGAKQLLPEVDYDPTNTTVTTGGEAHG